MTCVEKKRFHAFCYFFNVHEADDDFSDEFRSPCTGRASINRLRCGVFPITLVANTGFSLHFWSTFVQNLYFYYRFTPTRSSVSYKLSLKLQNVQADLISCHCQTPDAVVYSFYVSIFLRLAKDTTGQIDKLSDEA